MRHKAILFLLNLLLRFLPPLVDKLRKMADRRITELILQAQRKYGAPEAVPDLVSAFKTHKGASDEREPEANK